MLNKYNLRTRTAVAIISVVVLSLVVMTVFNYVKSSQLIKTEALSKVNAVSKDYADVIHTDIEKCLHSCSYD